MAQQLSTRRAPVASVLSRHGFARPGAREVAALVATAILVLVASLAALGREWWRVGLLGEWATYLLLALVLLSWRPFRSALARSGRGRQAAVFTILFLLALGQFIGGGRQTFPLVRFQMFTDPAATQLTQYHFLGVTRSGATVQVDPVGLYPSLDRGRFEGKLVQMTEAAIDHGPGSDAADTYERLLSALLHRHNLGARDPIIRLDVYGVDQRLDPPPRGREPVRALRVWSVEAGR
jgi:hypothetical protein